MDRRTRARELSMQALYQLDAQGGELLDELRKFFEENESDIAVRKLAWDWTRDTWENLALCDELITGSTLKWSLGRLSPVDRSILRLSVYQIKFCDSIPAKVVINEAVELAKKYGSDKSFAFVNGVLDAVLKKLKEEV